MEKIIAIDANEISPIMKNLGLDGLIAIAKRGDHFFYSDDFLRELERSTFLQSKNGKIFEAWIKKQLNPPIGYTPDVSIVGVDDVLEGEKDTYDPNQKRLTTRGGYETWDMSIRKRMAENPQFDYEVVSREKDFFENKNRQLYDPVTRTHARIVDVPFRYTSMKKLMAEMVVSPDLNLSKEQFVNIQKGWNSRFGNVAGLNQGTLYFPSTYEEAQRQRSLRSSPQGEKFGLSGQVDGQFGGMHVDSDTGVPISPTGANLNDLTDNPLDPSASIGGKAKGFLREGPGIGRRFRKLARMGAPIAVLGLAAGAVLPVVQARAEERNIPFTQAAQEIGLDFSEDELKSLAAEVGVDLAVSLTPVGLVKKAWDILGNIDDIVAVTQLYGAAYPDNETIQQLARIADTVEGSDTFGAYVEGRDALTGAVGDVIDFVFSESADEEAALEGLGKINSALEPETGDLARVLSPDATRPQIAEVLKSAARGPVGAGTVPLSNFPLIPGARPILSPEFVPSLKVMPSAESSHGSETTPPTTPHPKPGLDLLNPVSDLGVGPVTRKTSYDRLGKLGRTPEEEALAFDDYHHHLRESFVAMDGDMEAAHLLAVRQFHRDWDVSVFAPDEEGTVMKNPVERVYPALDDKGHDYVRKDVDTLLAGQGIKAARWYLSPNEKTGSDWRQGATDEDGYGPRMTLVFDDEAGGRHHVTDSFQANVWGASKQKVPQKGQTSEPVEFDKNVPILAAKPVPVSSPPIPAPKPHQTG